MRRRIILGTAGHIDHGKTSLVKALTGIDTDRLKEEKERGITIELGFAHLTLPDGTLVGIVDVPGHERFVKNMVAGASGIDVVALVIAADEGVMPQTEEHLEICELLGIRHGLIVITKIDMVDEEWLELVEEDIKEHVKGTFLESAPIVKVSSVTGKGLNDFLDVLSDLIQKIPEKQAGYIFRLPVDRVFTIKGFGTVVTGTSISGMIRVGDEVTVYPKKIDCKVRSIQVHGNSVEETGPSTRTALSLQGLTKEDIERGYVIASKDSLFPSYILDVFLHFLSSAKRPLKNREKVRFHVGTSEVLANIVFLDREELMPSEYCYAQIRLEEPVAVLRGDRFVIRSYSPVRTIGGGEIIHPLAKKKKRKGSEKIINILDTIHKGTEKDVVESFILMEGYEGINKKMLLFLSNLSEHKLNKILQELDSSGKVHIYEKEQGLFIHSEFYDKLKELIISAVKEYHTRYPLRAGIPKEELRSRLRVIKDVRLFNYMIESLIKEDLIVSELDNIKIKDYRPRLTDAQEKVKTEIEKIYKDSEFQPPYFKEIREKYPELGDQVLEYLLSQGILVKIKEDLYLHIDSLENMIAKVRSFLEKHGQMSVGDFKALTNTSRKYSIPFLEYLDKSQITVRVGDIRKLRK